MSEDVTGGSLLRVGEELKPVLLALRHEVAARRARGRAGRARRTRAGAGARHAQPVSALRPQQAVLRRPRSAARRHRRRSHDVSPRRRTVGQQAVALALFALLTIFVLLSRARLVGQVL